MVHVVNRLLGEATSRKWQIRLTPSSLVLVVSATDPVKAVQSLFSDPHHQATLGRYYFDDQHAEVSMDMRTILNRPSMTNQIGFVVRIAPTTSSWVRDKTGTATVSCQSEVTKEDWKDMCLSNQVYGIRWAIAWSRAYGERFLEMEEQISTTSSSRDTYLIQFPEAKDEWRALGWIPWL